MQTRERSQGLCGLGIPTVATFAVLTRELGGKRMLLATAVMVMTAATVGGILNLVPPSFSA